MGKRDREKYANSISPQNDATQEQYGIVGQPYTVWARPLWGGRNDSESEDDWISIAIEYLIALESDAGLPMSEKEQARNTSITLATEKRLFFWRDGLLYIFILCGFLLLFVLFLFYVSVLYFFLFEFYSLFLL